MDNRSNCKVPKKTCHKLRLKACCVRRCLTLNWHIWHWTLRRRVTLVLHILPFRYIYREYFEVYLKTPFETEFELYQSLLSMHVLLRRSGSNTTYSTDLVAGRCSKTWNRGIKKKTESNLFYDFYSYGHLLVITGYKWDYTFYKWGYKYL